MATPLTRYALRLGMAATLGIGGALVAVQPAEAVPARCESPATTYDVFFDTDEVTRPPAARMRSVACSRVRSGSVPVSTNVISRSAPSPGGGPS